MAYDIEVTDLFGGEANYGWVRRYRIDATPQATVHRRAKAVAGWTGLRCDTEKYSIDQHALRLRGACQIMFITWTDEPVETPV